MEVCHLYLQNRRSTITGSELIGFGEGMTFITRTKHFLKSQMRSTNINFSLKSLEYNATIKQEDVGIIQLERDRRKLSSKRMKHINV